MPIGYNGSPTCSEELYGITNDGISLIFFIVSEQDKNTNYLKRFNYKVKYLLTISS